MRCEVRTCRVCGWLYMCEVRDLRYPFTGPIDAKHARRFFFAKRPNLPFANSSSYHSRTLQLLTSSRPYRFKSLLLREVNIVSYPPAGQHFQRFHSFRCCNSNTVVLSSKTVILNSKKSEVSRISIRPKIYLKLKECEVSFIDRTWMKEQYAIRALQPK